MFFKSQTRRLYDIANVLKSLGIIEKVKYFQAKAEKNQKEKKNAFKWIGSEGFQIDQEDEPINLQKSIQEIPKTTEQNIDNLERDDINVQTRQKMPE